MVEKFVCLVENCGWSCDLDIVQAEMFLRDFEEHFRKCVLKHTAAEKGHRVVQR